MSPKSHVFKPFRIDAIKQEDDSVSAKTQQQAVKAEAKDFPALRSYDKYAAVAGHVASKYICSCSLTIA